MNAQVRNAEHFLSTQPLRMYIGGDWTPAASGKTFDTLDPGSGERLAAVPAADG